MSRLPWPRLPQVLQRAHVHHARPYDPQKTAETWDMIHQSAATGSLRQTSKASQLLQSGTYMAPSNWTLFHVLRKKFMQHDLRTPPRIVVDLGSGTGETLLSLANKVGDKVHLLGSDISAEAVRQANTKAAGMGLSSRVRFIHTAIETFPWAKVPELTGCRNGNIVAINVDHVVQYLPPEIRESMMTEIGTHLQPGGIVSIRTITPSGPFFENIKTQKTPHPNLPNAFLNQGTFIQFLQPQQLCDLFDTRYTPLCDFSTLVTPYQYGVGVPLQSYMRIAQYQPGSTPMDPGISRPPFLRYVTETLPPKEYSQQKPMKMLCVGYPPHYDIMKEISQTLHHYYDASVSLTESESPLPKFPDNSFDAIYLTADHHMPEWDGTKGFRTKLLSGQCQANLLRLVRPGGIISANVTKPAHTDSVSPDLDTIRASFFCTPTQNPCLVVTEGTVYRGPQTAAQDRVWRLATRVDHKPPGVSQYRHYHQMVRGFQRPLPGVQGLTMSDGPIVDPGQLAYLNARTATYFDIAATHATAAPETYHHYTGQQSKSVSILDEQGRPISVQLFRDYGDHGLSAKGHDLLYFPRDVMPRHVSQAYQHVLGQDSVQHALKAAKLPLNGEHLSARLTINAYRLLDARTGLHAGFPPHVDLSSNGQITVILSGTPEHMAFFRLGRRAEGPLSREDIALGTERQELVIPAGALTVIQGNALTHWAHEVLPMVRDPKGKYFSWVFGVQGR